MAFIVPKNTLIFAHEVKEPLSKTDDDLCNRVEIVTPEKVIYGVKAICEHYHKEYRNEQNKHPTIEIHFEPTVGLNGKFYFVVIPEPIMKYEDY